MRNRKKEKVIEKAEQNTHFERACTSMEMWVPLIKRTLREDDGTMWI
jgi:hypothetical protein